MRANRISPVVEMLPAARDLYLQCVEEDPRFAPAWAQLGRTYRVLGKYGLAVPDDCLRLAESAFQRSLELDPDLPLAHHLYAYFEIEEGGRAQGAMVRLLERARDRPRSRISSPRSCWRADSADSSRRPSPPMRGRGDSSPASARASRSRTGCGATSRRR